MKMPTNPIELLACAIARQEGWFVKGSIPQIDNNPGDLVFAGQINARSGPSGFAIFSSPTAGVVALYRQILIQTAQGQTIAQLIEQWAPSDQPGNNTVIYLANVLAWTGLPADVPIMNLMPALVML